MRAGYPSEHLIVLVLTLPKRSTAFTCRYTEHSSSKLVYGKTDAKANFNKGCWCILKGETLLQLDLYYSLYFFVYCSWKLRKQNITNSLNNANSQYLLIVEYDITPLMLFSSFVTLEVYAWIKIYLLFIWSTHKNP